MGRVAPQAEPAYATFSTCIPRLAGSTGIFARSLAILVISPDPDQHHEGSAESDGDLALRGLRRAQDVSTFALGMINDTPALRRKHAQMVQTTLAGLARTSDPMIEALSLTRERLSTLAEMQGLNLIEDVRRA